MWVGGVADSQTRSKPLKTTPNHPKNRPFLPEFHLLFSQISQKPLGGWVNRFDLGLWEISQKKVFFGRASQYCTAGKLYYATSADSGAAGFSSGTSWLNMINAGPASTFIQCKLNKLNHFKFEMLKPFLWTSCHPERWRREASRPQQQQGQPGCPPPQKKKIFKRQCFW